MTETKVDKPGLLYGLGAYGIWGLVPLFWRLLDDASAGEILGMRMVWSLVFAAILSLIILPRDWFRRMATRRTLLLLAAASAVVSINWGTFIWATNHGHVTETALGYYINPIVSILFGVLLLRERLARWQWVAIAPAVAAVVVMTIEYGKLPWIALVLAFSFGSYGLIKNRVRAGAVQTLVIESGFMFLPAVVFLIILQARGTLTFGQLGLLHSLLLAAGGLVTLVPLLLFSAAATRIPLSVVGMLQYIAPTVMFLLGVLYFGEQMPAGRWIGFVMVWIALIILTIGMIMTLRRVRPVPAVGDVEEAPGVPGAS
ncbi:EamA family transporter RarD [Microlunatus sp. Gsoil 973]|uniref:EamA family transporter RarD n=1 Tax=Microlunatus sp. Gsoil 973 TaxID=2672569 RepID=UPI0012B48991|nr:EamA family transporter RarD [Microlunatus sp. Gsoil 973]QGN34877.1 EamA family transporter RarD [Microlunatus sp. Gsoil 973]